MLSKKLEGAHCRRAAGISPPCPCHLQDLIDAVSSASCALHIFLLLDDSCFFRTWLKYLFRMLFICQECIQLQITENPNYWWLKEISLCHLVSPELGNKEQHSSLLESQAFFVLLNHLSSCHSIDGCCTPIPSIQMPRQEEERKGKRAFSQENSVFIFRAPTSVPTSGTSTSRVTSLGFTQLQGELGYGVFCFLAARPEDKKKGVNSMPESSLSAVCSSVKALAFMHLIKSFLPCYSSYCIVC